MARLIVELKLSLTWTSSGGQYFKYRQFESNISCPFLLHFLFWWTEQHIKNDDLLNVIIILSNLFYWK